MGYDVFKSIDKWKNYEDILKYPIILLPRETNDNYEDFLFYKKELERKLNNAIFVSYLQEMVVLPISSTEVRKQLATNGNVSKLLNPQVLKIIQEKKLYKND